MTEYQTGAVHEHSILRSPEASAEAFAILSWARKSASTINLVLC